MAHVSVQACCTAATRRTSGMPLVTSMCSAHLLCLGAQRSSVTSPTSIAGTLYQCHHVANRTTIDCSKVLSVEATSSHATSSVCSQPDAVSVTLTLVTNLRSAATALACQVYHLPPVLALPTMLLECYLNVVPIVTIFWPFVVVLVHMVTMM